MDENTHTFKDWAKNLDREAVNIWREAMAQLRRLSDDVWNGLRFFLSINGLLIAASAVVIKLQGMSPRSAGVLIALALLGLLITLLARAIMTKQRENYLQMLLKKSLIEEEMGFYKTKLSGTDLSFVWRVQPEFFDALKQKPADWVRERRCGKGTITRLLFMVYDTLIVVYVGALAILAFGLYNKWF